MEVSIQEIQRIHALANAQNTDFIFHNLERIEGDKLLVYLKGIIQDEPGKVITDGEQAPQSGEFNAVIQVPLPPKDLLEHKELKGSALATTLGEKQVIYMFDHAEYPEEGGTFRYFKGKKHPEKGFPYPEVATVNNFVKKVLITQVRFFAKNPLIIVSFISNKILKRWVTEFNELSRIALDPYYWEDKRYMVCCREIKKFVFTFLNQLGIDEENADRFAKMFSHLIEFDQAYRFRINDLATVTNQEELLKNPRKAFQKILVALAERDNRKHMLERFRSFATLLSLALWIPKYKRAYVKALEAIDFSKIQMDEADYYHTLRIGGYDFGGRKIEDRIQEYIKIHEGILPPGYEVTVS